MPPASAVHGVARLAFLGAAAIALVGCAVDNDRLTLGAPGGDAVTLTSIEPGSVLTPTDQPSITGADRAHWPETLAPVPMDIAADHGFTADTRRWSNPRHAGRFPAPTEAVTVRGCEPAWSGARSWERVPGDAPGRGLTAPVPRRADPASPRRHGPSESGAEPAP